MPDLPAGWIEQMKQVLEILSEGHSIAREIIGEPSKSDAETKRKDPENAAERLTDELIDVADVATRLVVQLQRIKEQF
jgi:hypothetical protein